MIIKNEYPPNIEDIKSRFEIAPTVVFTYGDVIYNPSGKELPQHLIEHESTHRVQQLAYPGGPDAWWAEYLINQSFRLQEEVEAYRVQWDFILAFCNRRDRRALYAQITKDLSSKIYGSMCSAKEAQDLICP